MAAYTELIKKFDKIRDYMRDFYIYGFKIREGYHRKSSRSYDNEKRRIESYLSDVMAFRLDQNGKRVFISVDCSQIEANPLYRAFKAKSFTKNDITLHFYILDILLDHHGLSANQVWDIITTTYLPAFANPYVPDLATVRNKLKEYTKLGILYSEKKGKEVLFSLHQETLPLSCLRNALSFFGETSPLGVIGSFLLDKSPKEKSIFSFKHHYITHALESEILYAILKGIHSKEILELTNLHVRSNKETLIELLPLQILISTQGGRRYVAGYNPRSKNYENHRLDYIKAVRPLKKDPLWDTHRAHLDQLLKSTWGMSFGKGKQLHTLEMTLHIPPTEDFILSRLQREGRQGVMTRIAPQSYLYRIVVYDPMEMMPWIRTFLGRIQSLSCSQKQVEEIFYKDLVRLFALYQGGDTDSGTLS